MRALNFLPMCAPPPGAGTARHAHPMAGESETPESEAPKPGTPGPDGPTTYQRGAPDRTVADRNVADGGTRNPARGEHRGIGVDPRTTGRQR